jgi:MoxR-like ATPase
MTQPRTWRIFKGTGQPHSRIDKDLPDPPPWRAFHEDAPLIDRAPPAAILKTAFEFDEEDEEDQRALELINAAIYLRRPLLITGKPGAGKSSLANAIAHELRLGEVLEWPITTRANLQEGLYRYDAIARAQEKRPLEEIGSYIKLGPLGTALLPTERPRVLLIDEIDKCDIDLPNDLLHVFEKGWFEIPELVRLPDTHQEIKVRSHDSRSKDDVVTIKHGRVRCRGRQFPIVVLTSNGERDFPPAFLRRCIRLDIVEPSEKKLAQIVRAHLGKTEEKRTNELIAAFFVKRRDEKELATDQLLNAVYLATHHELEPGQLLDAIFRALK